MKTRKKTEAEMKADADILRVALEKCAVACKEFTQALMDYDLHVGHVSIDVFLKIRDAADDHRFALQRSKQPKVGDVWEELVTHKSNYEED